jgi:hypothetical protein
VCFIDRGKTNEVLSHSLQNRKQVPLSMTKHGFTCLPKSIWSVDIERGMFLLLGNA